MAVQPAPHRFTVEEFHRMGDAGVFSEDDRVELLEGEIVDMTPAGSRHAACVRSLSALFHVRLGGRAIIAVQDPVRLGPRSEPQPDLALLHPRQHRYAAAHPVPADVALVVEVSDATVSWDRQHKVPLYAAAAIPEVWIVDLASGIVETYRQPQGAAYGESSRAGRGQTLAPIAFPDIHLSVDEFLV